MNFSKEDRLSMYIDHLNLQKTGTDLDIPDDQEWEELIDTVHLVQITGLIDMPTPDFQEKGKQRIKQELEERQRKAIVIEAPKKRSWKKYYLPLAAACVVALSIIVPTLFPDQKVEAVQIRAVKEEQLVSLGVTKVNHPVMLSGGAGISFEKDEKIVKWNQADASFKEYPLESFQYMRSPDWSPNGKQIAFSGYQTMNAGIWVMEEDGSNVHQLAAPESPDEFYDHPSWSPDGKKLAFAKKRYTLNDSHGVNQTGEEVWTIEMDTGKLTKVAEGSEPRWSPDGNQIAFTKTRKDGESTQKEVWLINTDGTHSRKLTDGMEASWSPDGQFITFAKDTITHKKSEKPKAEIVTTFREIWAIHLDSKKESRLTTSKINEQQLNSLISSSKSETSNLPMEFVVNGQYSDWQPSWSKDGKSIVFVRDTNEESENHFSLMKISLKYE
ncbi:hypothetical protein [Neobacillus sp. Marseille-QA0830]